MKKNILKIIFALILVGLMTLNFTTNFLGDKNADIEGTTFETFQGDSEYLVFSEIFQDKYNLDTNYYGLAEVVDENTVRTENIWDKIENYNSQEKQLIVRDYVSQYGLQGHIFSFLYNKLHMPFWMLKAICSGLLAIVLVAICFFINKKYNKIMGIVFYITFLLSPWVVAFARNLYWVEFTWFLPALFGLILSMNLKKKKILIPCIALSIFIKCLCGYEYITSIMLMTIAFLLIDFVVAKTKEERKEVFKTIIITGIACLLAFGIALLLHSILRGNGNILEGIKSIYETDILRRTILVSDTSNFPDVYTASLQAGVLETVAKYFTWHTDIILGISGEYFRIMFVMVIAILIYNIVKKDKNSYRDLTMFIVFLATTISWYVLGKSHSYIHTTMNYVLWYFGFIQICLYIIIKFIAQVIYYISNKNIKRIKENKN